MNAMKEVLNKFRIKWSLSSYFALPAKILLIQSRIFAPVRALPGRFDNTEFVEQRKDVPIVTYQRTRLSLGYTAAHSVITATEHCGVVLLNAG